MNDDDATADFLDWLLAAASFVVFRRHGCEEGLALPTVPGMSQETLDEAFRVVAVWHVMTHKEFDGAHFLAHTQNSPILALVKYLDEQRISSSSMLIAFSLIEVVTRHEERIREIARRRAKARVAGSVKKKSRHQIEALNLFTIVRPYAKSKSAACQHVASMLEKKYQDPPTARTVGNWIAIAAQRT